MFVPLGLSPILFLVPMLLPIFHVAVFGSRALFGDPVIFALDLTSGALIRELIAYITVEQLR